MVILKEGEGLREVIVTMWTGGILTENNKNIFDISGSD
jgi:hypothetical protein